MGMGVNDEGNRLKSSFLMKKFGKLHSLFDKLMGINYQSMTQSCEIFMLGTTFAKV